jgi:hypothetical protein
MVEPGLDRHDWESEWAGLEEAIADSPVQALPEVDALVSRMLEERGYPRDEVELPRGEEDEVLSAYRAAAETTSLVERDEPTVSLGDVAAAHENYRFVFDTLVSERSAP